MERIKTYNFRLYPTKKQEELLNHHLWLSKELWNFLLQKEKDHYNETSKFIEKTELQKLTKKSGLFSQTAQAVCHRLYNAIMKMVRERKQGKNTGFPRFKNFFRMKSLYYPQAGFKLEEKLEVSPFGEIKIKKHREINGTIKTLTLKRTPSGKWFAMFVVYVQKKIPQQNNGPKTGLDFGLMNFATLSNGFTIPNPKPLIKHEQKLIFFQRRFSKKNKKSRNRNKAKIKLANVHEKIKNMRLDFLHKTSNALISNYSFIAIEKLATREMIIKGHGKGINDAGWSMFAFILCSKAEEAGCKVELVNSMNTTKECSRCKTIVPKSLYIRTHNCPKCGLIMDRDQNAALVILKRQPLPKGSGATCKASGSLGATSGHGGSNALEDGRTKIPSLNKEPGNHRDFADAKCGTFSR